MNAVTKFTGAAVVAISATAYSAGPATAADALTIVSFGGAYTKSQIEAYHKPYMAKTGIRINSEDYNGGLAQVRAQVEAGNVVWNLVDVELSDAVRGCDEGILEPIDHGILPPAPDGTPATDDFIENTLTECAVGEIVWSNVFAYDATKFSGKKPTKIADLFDTETFPGKRGLRKTPKVNLEWALMADGIPQDRIYDVLSTPEGVDRAFAKLDTIKDDVIWWEAGAQPPQMLADGEVTIAAAYNGRLFNAIFNEKKPFEIVWDGQVWDLDLWVIPKGAKNMEATLDFVKFSTDTQRLADQSKWISYGPVRKSSFPLVADEMKPHMPTAPENFKTALQNDYEFWADHTDELNERFAAWLAK
ncbi:polyamine ABC transporter substrate-binding protein [Pelagibius sp. Alg239-R121]|uniref:polyamine ABC transporter substrate-binding protein n=1 Tax=Pelagibius sp. Alg239-R121 TaxID=2993448 RepID=UPI0024A64649|nr:polyamine ABC transporter substrate-binding protein [Pelagibius sp. Alg239-R121]